MKKKINKKEIIAYAFITISLTLTFVCVLQLSHSREAMCIRAYDLGNDGNLMYMEIPCKDLDFSDFPRPKCPVENSLIEPFRIYTENFGYMDKCFNKWDKQGKAIELYEKMMFEWDDDGMGFTVWDSNIMDDFHYTLSEAYNVSTMKMMRDKIVL